MSTRLKEIVSDNIRHHVKKTINVHVYLENVGIGRVKIQRPDNIASIPEQQLNGNNNHIRDIIKPSCVPYGHAGTLYVLRIL